MVEVRIYVEGGGEGPLLDALFREAWREFFNAAGLAGRMPRVIRGKSRQRTYDLFRTAVANPMAGTLALLLVDSEDPVLPADTIWQHLKRRDNWDRPDNAGTDDAFLMVQVMETWFLADRHALRTFFGPKLNEKVFDAWPELESVPKAIVFRTLERATAQCKTNYAKGRVSFDLLRIVNPAAVEQQCPHARRLLTRLRNLA